MDNWQDDTILIDPERGNSACEGCGHESDVLLPTCDGRLFCAACCYATESIRDTALWNGVNPLDPVFAEETLPMDRTEDLQARIRNRLQA